MSDRFWRPWVLALALICVTGVAIKTGDMSVLWWYLAPLAMWIFE
jgi:hypothetical protein